MVRNRFGGDTKRDSDYDRRDRRVILGNIQEREGQAEIVEFGFRGRRFNGANGTNAHACIMSHTDERSAFAAFCEYTGEAMRPDGTSRISDGNVDIQLTYGPDGRLASAHARTERRYRW